MNIPIVVVAYNRPDQLSRLLQSLSRAKYSINVKLIISIDGGDNSDVVSTAENFYWEHGDIEIIKCEKNLGLRNHILKCGDLTDRYDGIILLEDDLYVSPFFYDYAVEALNYYEGDANIAGISLYSHRYNETAGFPFIPMTDDSDVFFLQIASSWGQAWTKQQWKAFRNWYSMPNSLCVDESVIMPDNVLQWPETSWKKYFIKYMIEKNLFFVYPQLSYTTNFGDEGTHHSGTDIYQVPLQYNKSENVFKNFQESNIKYDAFCEILPQCLNYYTDCFHEYRFTVDLYGTKAEKARIGEYILTTCTCSDCLFSFGLKLIPAELNIFERIPGNSISFSRIEALEDTADNDESDSFIKNFVFYYSQISPIIHELNQIRDQFVRLNKSMKLKIGKVILFPLFIVKKAIVGVVRLLKNQ